MNEQYQTLQYRPHPMQFLIDNLLWILFFAVAVIYVGAENIHYRPFTLSLSVFLGLYLLLDFVSLRKKLFVVTSQTLVYDRGIFYRNADFIELYRVIDFQERQSFLQQLFGLKTVIVYSGDRTTPQLFIPGVSHKEDLIGIIRERVEYNKTRRGVYEITNRP